MAQVRKLTPEQLQEEFDKIQRAVAFTRGFKRDGSPQTRASSKKLKTGGDDVNLAATSHGVSQEEAGATPSPNVSQEEVAAPSRSQDIPDAPVQAPSTTASTAQHTGSSPKKVGTRKKRLGRKGVHPSHYRKRIFLFESHEGGTGAGVWADQQQWVIRSWRLFPFSGVHVLETISGKILYMFADTPYPLSAQLMKKMLKHKLEVEIDGIGNDMTYAEQLIQFIKNQVAASIPSA
ncbi:hypothetical protein Tco_0825797 [Tanacetum coccineum]